jgi:hypothetical protein
VIELVVGAGWLAVILVWAVAGVAAHVRRRPVAVPVPAPAQPCRYCGRPTSAAEVCLICGRGLVWARRQVDGLFAGRL